MVTDKSIRCRQLTDFALLVNMARHDSKFALARLDDAWAVRSDNSALLLSEELVLYSHHVLLRNTCTYIQAALIFNFQDM
jgi:hypothetical protein